MASTRRILGAIVLGGGVIAVAVGIVLMGAYVVGVIQVLDEPDRSWLFWGLAILFLGIALAGIGGRLAILGRNLIRSA